MSGTRWALWALAAGIVAMMAMPLVAPGLLPSPGFLACDASGGEWDAASAACSRSDSPLSGAAL